MRRYRVTDALFDDLHPALAEKVIEGIRLKDYMALMFQELRVMQLKAGADYDRLAASAESPEVAEQKRRLSLQYAALALAARGFAYLILRGEEGFGGGPFHKEDLG